MERSTIHASLVSMNGVGILITGDSGSGKTSLAIALVKRGAEFVADDAVVIESLDGMLFGSAPLATRGLIAIDGNVLTISDIFRECSFSPFSPIHFQIRL